MRHVGFIRGLGFRALLKMALCEISGDTPTAQWIPSPPFDFCARTLLSLAAGVHNGRAKGCPTGWGPLTILTVVKGLIP